MRPITDPHIVIAIACCGAAVIFALLAYVLGLDFPKPGDHDDHPMFPPF